MKHLKSLLGVLILLFTQTSFAKIEYGVTGLQKETLQWTFEKAQKFSGIQSQSPDNWEKIKYYLMTAQELSAQACPEDPQNCRGLAALFETVSKTIYIREDLSPDSDMISLSFLLHEMVHSLQSETKSDDELFGTCQKLYGTEKQAYDAQDAFLKSEGQFFRAGNALRYFICHE